MLKRTGCLLILVAIFFAFPDNWSAFSQVDSAGISAQRLAEIEKKVGPVLNGQPVTTIEEEDRKLLFMAEELFPDSFDLFFRHGEYLAEEKAQYTEAVPRLKRALEIKEKDLKTLELLATCYYALKEAAEETSCWESLREILEDYDSSEAEDLRQRVMGQLERLAIENSMIMRSGKRFIVYTPDDGAYMYVADELTDARLEEVYRQVTGDLNCIPAFRTSIVVLTPDDFDNVKPTSWAGAFATGDKSMVLSADSFPKTNRDTVLPSKPIVLHEYTHNIVHVAAAGSCPIWLNEGLAVFQEKKEQDFNEFTPGVWLNQKILGIEDLEAQFIEIRSLGMEHVDKVRDTYKLAWLYARFLIQNYTLAAPRQILNGLKGGASIEKMLFNVTNLTVGQFEKEFRQWISEMKN
jgi:tetratricopeptide (TPR) repeat protein